MGASVLTILRNSAEEHRMPGQQQEQSESGQELTADELAHVEAAFYAQHNISTLLDQLPFALWIKDVQGRYVGANQQWLDAESFASITDIAGVNDYDLFEPARAAANIRRDWEVLDQGRPLMAMDSIDRSGKTETQRITRMPLRDSYHSVVGVVGFSAATATIAEAPTDDAALEIDQTTGVGVQAALQARVCELIHSDQPGSLMLIRLDDHGIVSESLGHEFGDMLLRAAARRLTTTFGPHRLCFRAKIVAISRRSAGPSWTSGANPW